MTSVAAEPPALGTHLLLLLLPTILEVPRLPAIPVARRLPIEL